MKKGKYVELCNFRRIQHIENSFYKLSVSSYSFIKRKYVDGKALLVVPWPGIIRRSLGIIKEKIREKGLSQRSGWSVVGDIAARRKADTASTTERIERH